MAAPPLDPPSVLSAILAVAIGVELAEYLGPYGVIIAGGAAGACFALTRMEPQTTKKAVAFVAWMTVIAAILTVSVAQLIHTMLPSVEAKWLFAPLALMIGGIGRDWQRVGEWLVRTAGRFLERRGGIDKQGEDR